MDVFCDNFGLLFSGQYGKLSVIRTIVNKPTSIIPVDLSWKKPDLDYLISIQTYQLLAIRLCNHEVPFALLPFCHRR